MAKRQRIYFFTRRIWSKHKWPNSVPVIQSHSGEFFTSRFIFYPNFRIVAEIPYFFSLIHNKRSGKSCAAQVRLVKKNEAAEETAKVAEKVNRFFSNVVTICYFRVDQNV